MLQWLDIFLLLSKAILFLLFVVHRVQKNLEKTEQKQMNMAALLCSFNLLIVAKFLEQQG